MRRPGWRPVLAAAGLLALAAVPAAPAQEQKPPSPAFLEGTEAFRRLIFDAGKELCPDGFQALGSFGELNDPQNDPKDTVLIVFGEPRRLAEVPGGLPLFLRRGGALLLATDRPLGDVQFSVGQTTGFVASGQLVECREREECYHGLPSFPFVQPQRGADPDLFRGLVAEGSAGSIVATNAPSYLEPAANLLAPPPLAPLAWLPPRCVPEGARGVFFDRLLFAVGGDMGDGGRVLFLADHSIFINDMMMRQDNGNVEFSYNCLKYLTDRPDGPRTKVLFVEDGKINTRLEVPLKEVPDELANRMLDFLLRHLPEVAQKTTPALERDLQSMDRRNGFNGLVLKWFREHDSSPYGLLRLLAVLAAVVVVLYGCYRIGWRARHRSDLQGPLLASALHRLAPVGSVTDQRRQALVRGDNLWEPARHLARQCLASAGAAQGAAPPPVAVRGGWLRRWALAGRVKLLWRLAYGPPVRVPLGEWRRLLRDVRELRAAFADGTVQFT